MCLIIDFKARTGVDFGVPAKDCGNNRDAWCKDVVRAPFLKRQLEKVFGVPVQVDMDGGEYRACLPASIEVTNERWSESYSACSNAERSEAHAIAHLHYLLTTRLASQQSVIRQVMAEDGHVRAFKYDARRMTFYLLDEGVQKIRSLLLPPKVS